MITTPDRRPVDAVVLALLRDGTGKAVGDAEIPGLLPGQTQAERYPYAILYPILGGGFSGPPLAYPEADATFAYQVSCVGARRDQAQWMADVVRRTMVARTPSGAFQVAIVSPPPLKVNQRSIRSAPDAPRPSGSPPNRIWSLADTYDVSVTPA